jgi:hypothetical protein
MNNSQVYPDLRAHAGRQSGIGGKMGNASQNPLKVHLKQTGSCIAHS